MWNAADGNYDQVILSWNDYYAFGMTMQGRNGGVGYRYQFNGMETDNEISGSGNSYTTEFRQYDPRLGRWKSLDPLMAKFPYSSPYVAFANNPIYFTDPYGLEPVNDGGGDDIVIEEEGRGPGMMGDHGSNNISISNSNESIQIGKDPNKPKSYFINNQGFFIEGESTFGEYVGNVKPTDDRNKELERIRGRLYHKNTSNVPASVGNWINDTFGGDDDYWVEKKPYDRAEESFNEMILFTAEFYITGLVITKVGKYALGLLKNAGNSIWKLAPSSRGFVYETFLGGNLVKNYPVIDKFINGVATSIKTLDLGAKTYTANVKTIFSRLKTYIDDLHGFQGTIHGGVNTTNNAIKTKILEIGIPRGATTTQNRAN